MQESPKGKGKQNDMNHQLEQVQLNLKIGLRQYQNLHNQLAVRTKLGYDNNQNLLSVFVRVASVSFKPIEALLRLLDDRDILSLASTCQTIYRFVYSPLGYRMMQHLRPVVVRIRRQGEMPVYNKNYLQNLCNDVNLVNMDEDDKIAVIQTMKTNLMAARQKMREIEECNEEWERRKSHIKQQMLEIGNQRSEQSRQIQLIVEQKQKLFELLKESSTNIDRLKEEQEKMLEERERRKNELQIERNKLTRQKQLLIKKIKAQQKEREEALVYAREVSRITNMLNKLTHKKQDKK